MICGMEVTTGNITSREPSVEMKREFVDNLFRLSGAELAKVIEKLNERCDSALDKVKVCSVV